MSSLPSRSYPIFVTPLFSREHSDSARTAIYRPPTYWSDPVAAYITQPLPHSNGSSPYLQLPVIIPALWPIIPRYRMCPVRQHSYSASNPYSAMHRNGTGQPHGAPSPSRPTYSSNGNGHSHGNGHYANGSGNGSPHRRRSSNIAVHSNAHATSNTHARSLSLSRSTSHRSPLVPLPLASNNARPAMPPSAATSPAIYNSHAVRATHPIHLPPPAQMLVHSMSANTLPTIRVLNAASHEPAVPSQFTSIRYGNDQPTTPLAQSFAHHRAATPVSAHTQHHSHLPSNVLRNFRQTDRQNNMSQAAGNLVNGVKVTRMSYLSQMLACLEKGRMYMKV